MEIKCKVSITGGRLITRANIDRIKAVGTYRGHVRNGVELKGKQIHSVKEEPEGFIFICDETGCGINGHHKTLRDLVVSVVLGGYGRTVIVMDDDK